MPSDSSRKVTSALPELPAFFFDSSARSRLAQLPCLVRAAGELAERLARRERFDAARPRADRALGCDHERADLGRRADMRAPAELS